MGRLLAILIVAVVLYVMLRPRAGIAFLQKLPRLVAVLFALLYMYSPIDLIPDAGPIGFLDDILILLASLWLSGQKTSRQRADEAQSAKAEQGQEENCAERQSAWDPHAILGVTREASPTEITRAYREQMKRYHPDRVADLGEELQQVAHRKTLDIQRAYEELK